MDRVGDRSQEQAVGGRTEEVGLQESHRAGLEELIKANGLDLASAKAHGQYLSLDAAETLSQFMIDGMPEPGRFHTVLGGVIASVTDGRPRVKAFGEMVALLWSG